MAQHALGWFEISVTDFERARAFYEEVLGVTLEVLDLGTMLRALFPAAEGGVGGALQYDEKAQASEYGTVVYLEAGEDLQPALDRVVAAGGQVIVPKDAVPGDTGYYALFRDCEGNRVGLMSPS